MNLPDSVVALVVLLGVAVFALAVLLATDRFLSRRDGVGLSILDDREMDDWFGELLREKHTNPEQWNAEKAQHLQRPQHDIEGDS